MGRLNTVPGVGMGKYASGSRWIDWLRERKPWAAYGPSKYKQFVKARKARLERRKAKQDPETLPTYRRYRGWDD